MANTTLISVQPKGTKTVKRSTNGSGGPMIVENVGQRPILTLEIGRDATAYAWRPIKKWTTLSAIHFLQLSMNWNAAIYANAMPGMMEEFNLSVTKTSLGGCLFLVFYAVGCELWAPFSEEFGRKWVLGCSLALVNTFNLGCALAPNYGAILAFRILGGLSSAGGSVTLGQVADMYEPNNQQYGLSFVVLASVAGSVLPPVFGSIIQVEASSWRWIFWVSFIIGVVAQVGHLCTPESHTEVLLEKEAKKRREADDVDWMGPREAEGTLCKRIRENPKKAYSEIFEVMGRPYKFLLTEPIVGSLSLLSGFSDMLVYVGLDAFPLIMGKWGLNTEQKGLCFLTLLVSYVLTYLMFLLRYRKDRQDRETNDIKPEHRLWVLLWTCLGMPLGLLGLAFASLGPAYHVHWVVPLIGVFFIGVANYAIYMATIDYMVAGYGKYAASATGGNGFARDFLAGIAVLWARPFYNSMAKGTEWQYVWPTVVLAGIGFLLCIPVYIFYLKGEDFRAKSKYCDFRKEPTQEMSQQPQNAPRISSTDSQRPIVNTQGTLRITTGATGHSGSEVSPAGESPVVETAVQPIDKL